MTTQWEKEKADIKDKGFTETIAQAVHKYLNALRDNREKRQTRWIWELLQNAHDASIASSDKNLIASIKYNSEKLVFLHNGGGFKKKQIQRLIFHGSTKVEDEEAIGQYGSGFLATHLLSWEIDVSGKLDDGEWFDFRLARRPDESVKALRESMNQAWKDFNPCPSPQVPMPDGGFTTRFTYPIIENDAVDAVEKGIAKLEQCAPYLVVFNERFSRIEIDIDTKDRSENICFEVLDRLPLDQEGIQQITVVESKNENRTQMKFLRAQGNKASVTIPLTSIDNSSVCLSVEKTPRLFSGFPLVGTESFSFPAVINSFKFTPTEDRDGVVLGTGTTKTNHNNQVAIEEACELLVCLIRHAASKHWHHVHRWAEVPDIPEKEWINSEWLKNCIEEKLIKEIRQTSVVLNATSNPIAPKEAFLPLAKSDEGVETLWDLSNNWQGICEKLPQKNEATGWCKVIKSWAKVSEREISKFKEAIDGERLALYVQNTSHDFVSHLKLKEGTSAINWLDQLISFLENNELREVIRQYRIVPSQAGSLHRLPELHRDRGIDEELKDIAKLLEWHIRPCLRDALLNSLTEEAGLGNMEPDAFLSMLLEKLRDRAKKKSRQRFQGGKYTSLCLDS